MAIKLSDSEILVMMFSSDGGDALRALYENGDAGDSDDPVMDLCSALAYWTGNDSGRMDAMFRASAMMSDAWDSDSGGRTLGETAIAAAISGCSEPWDGSVPSYDQTDTGNAERLRDMSRGLMRYCHAHKCWYVYDGIVWSEDTSGAVKRQADKVIAAMHDEYALIDDVKERVAAMKWYKHTASSSGKEAMIRECQHLEGMQVNADDLDPRTPYLNCRNGVVDLRTGKLLPHDPKLMMSKVCDVDYDVNHGRPERWIKFLEDITRGDKELQDYLQRSLGYSMMGSAEEQCLYIMYGQGNDGKSTLMSVMSDILGGYARNAQPDTIMGGRGLGSSGSASGDIARLEAARMVTCEEPEKGVKLKESLVKQLTGTGRVTARHLFQREIEFVPNFVLWIATNHMPTIRGTDRGIWRRIKVVPMDANIPESKVDKRLLDKLRAEYPQILAWLVEGCIEWQRSGLRDPDCVKAATVGYKEEMDTIGCFISECLVQADASSRLPASELFSVYTGWCEASNEYRMSAKMLGMEMAKRGYQRGRSGSGAYYSGVALSDDGRDLAKSKRVYTADMIK